MSKILATILAVFIFISFFLSTNVYAYWNNLEITHTVTAQIGVWDYKIIPDEWNLNIWEAEGNLNRIIPENQLFSYNGLLYVVRDGEEYNPHWHGLPGEPNTQWAYVSLELEWRPNMNYRTFSVVVREGRYFIANPAYNDDWFVGDPLNSANKAWSEWREIEPLPESYFGFLLDYPMVKDYRANIADVIFITN